MLQIIISSVIIMLASLVGVIAVWKRLGTILEKNLHFLVSFSSGVFLIITLSLILEAMEHSNNLVFPLFWLMIGVVLISIIFKLLPTFHHHHDNHEAHSHNHLDVRKIVLSDAIHNIGDGVLIASTFAVNFNLGVITVLSVFIHEIIQEISQFFVMREAGYSTKKALIINFIASSTILIGAIIGHYLLKTFEIIEVPLLAITAGSFLVVVVKDLIPHSIKNASKSHLGKHIFWFILGSILMYAVGLLAPHMH